MSKNKFGKACRQAGLSSKDIHTLCGREDLLSQVKLLLHGCAEIKEIEHVIDFDAEPFIPKGMTLLPVGEQLPNRVSGKMTFGSAKVKLHRDRSQETELIGGNELRKNFEIEPVYGAQLMDFYLAYPQLIPEEWKHDKVFFWGTLYKLPKRGDLCVRYLHKRRSRWCWHFYRIYQRFGLHDQAAISTGI